MTRRSEVNRAKKRLEFLANLATECESPEQLARINHEAMRLTAMIMEHTQKGEERYGSG